MTTATNGHKTIPEYPIHELAYMFPSMTEAEYEGLKEDIAANGVHQAIVVWRGEVVDGRHRYEACKELGIESDAVPFRHLGDDEDAEAIVWSSNMSRRQLSIGQRSIISARWKIPAKAGKFTAKERANRAGVNVGAQERADAVFKFGDGAIVDSVFLGKISLHDAYDGVMEAKRAARAAAEAAEAKQMESERLAKLRAEEQEARAARNTAAAAAAAERAERAAEAAEAAAERAEREEERAAKTAFILSETASKTLERREKEVEPKVETSIIRDSLAQALDRPHLGQGTENEGWYTPNAYIDAARVVMSGISLDPASSAEAQRVVQADRFYTVEDDGLVQDWEGSVWLNPPYTKGIVDAFAEKLVQEYGDGDVRAAICITNNATDTAWFHTLATRASAWFFPRGRTKFWTMRPDGTEETGAPLQGQVLTYFGPDPLEFISEFEQRIGGIGMVKPNAG